MNISVFKRLGGYYRSKLVDRFLHACGNIMYGTLIVESPKGKIYDFVGQFPGPIASIQIKNWQVVHNLITKGDMGFAKDYINALWDSDNLQGLLSIACLNEPVFKRYSYSKLWYKFIYLFWQMLKANTKKGSHKNINHHYDLGNSFYKLWLDSSMTYSCALFSGNKKLSLKKAQQAKYSRIVSKLNVKPGDYVLDIGCGWGALAEYLAKRNINVTAITLSETQAQFAKERIIRAGLQKRAIIKLADYRDITGIFDHIISIGMFEHVGKQYWQTYFKIIASHLKKGGKAIIQTIVIDEKFSDKKYENEMGFIKHYIFPGGCLPSHSLFINAAKKEGLLCNESFVFGKDYILTLKHWLTRFEKQLPKIKKLGFDEKFIRKWRFYLSYSIAAFLSDRTNVVQFELMHE